MNSGFQDACLDAAAAIRALLNHDGDGINAVVPPAGSEETARFIQGIITIAADAVTNAAAHQGITPDQYLDRVVRAVAPVDETPPGSSDGGAS